MPAKAKNKVGRPTTEVDWKTVNTMCAIQCTGEEIAAVLDIHYDTLNAACNRDHEVNFSEYYKKKSQAGKPSLRRLQWKNAENGSVPMQIWLGKQYLGQEDKPGDSGGNESLAEAMSKLADKLPD